MPSVKLIAKANFPSQYGKFTIFAFRSTNGSKEEHIALVKGNVSGATNIPVRMHSECLTGDVFHSLRCDCHAQLEAALQKIGKLPRGIILYMRQEGRGIGLGNKIRAYALQDRGMDTVQANHALGFPSDMRDYEEAAQMLRLLKVKSVALITNNPQKIADLTLHGAKITRRIPHEFGKTKHNRAYLLVKKNKLGHIMRKV